MILLGKDYSGPCPCGHSHTMETALCVVEAGCLERFGDYLAQVGLTGPVAAVYDENTYNAQGLTRPRADFEIILPARDLHANERGVALLRELLPEKARVLAAVGAGTVHDLTRYVAWEQGLEFVACPTAASVDGFCSGVAAMTWGGAKRTLSAVPPRLVLADLEVIRRAPLRLARSGFGDMVGKYIALTDWRAGHILTGEHFCPRIAALTEQATAAVLETGEGILAGDPEAYEKLMGGLLLSGLAMQLLGTSRPASGAEHHISHLIEMGALGLSSTALHGEKVGVGTLMMARLYKALGDLPPERWGDYRPYGPGELQAAFGPQLAPELEKENRPDPCAGLTAGQLRRALPQLRQALERIPDPDRLETIYTRLGLCRTLGDIGVPEALGEELPLWAPAVRCRLTILRLLRCMEVKL